MKVLGLGLGVARTDVASEDERWLLGRARMWFWKRGCWLIVRDRIRGPRGQVVDRPC